MASTPDWDVAVGLAIAVLRRKLRLTQEALAAAAHIHRNYLADVERGKKSVTVGVLYGLAVGLSTTPDKVLKLALSYFGEPAKFEAALASLPPARPGRPPKT